MKGGQEQILGQILDMQQGALPIAGWAEMECLAGKGLEAEVAEVMSGSDAETARTLREYFENCSD
jgi:hypothetical protein